MEESQGNKDTVQKIYIVRHGQTDYNKNGIIQGSGVNSSLNDTGRKQAKQFYEGYKHLSFDRIFTSGLVRTKESIHEFIQRGTPVTSLNELNEISWGPYDGVLDTSIKDSYYWKTLEAWKEGDTSRCIEGGESPEMVQERLAKGWSTITENAEDENILVSMHGRAIRILLAYLTATPLKDMDQFVHTNLGLYVVEHRGGSNEVVVRNETKHLL